MKISQTNKMMKRATALLLVVASLGLAQPVSAAAPAAQKSFASPAAAASALADAVRAGDVKALLTVVGPSSRQWLSSGDVVADREDWARFLAAYDHRHDVTEAGDGRAVLVVGDDAWPFPAPIKRQGGAWVFDAAAGREEVLNRRIGRNELSTIQTLQAIVDAQREYAATDADGNGHHDYARRFGSSPGTRNGLYWPAAADEIASPLGALVAHAASEGYDLKARATKATATPQAYHGYLYRILSSQGKAASGGAYSYLVGDRLMGGFAVVAYPAKYGVSGVMTFLVNHEGVVFERDLGTETTSRASRMRSFNPGEGWKRSSPP